MRAIVVMYDSLNRLYLPNYGDRVTFAPNFRRLGGRTLTFDRFYAGSLPCMPARRELHTGRYNFLHRSWGPLEPFDRSLPQLLADHRVYTHCVTDHAHYWQDGGEAYLARFSTCDMIRGQEGDLWRGDARGFTRNADMRRQDAINRRYMPEEEDHPHARTCAAGLRFLEDNVDADNWFLQLEYFDPHEPFFVPQKYRDLYGAPAGGLEWPAYGPVDEGAAEVAEARLNYRALLSMCDAYLGKVLDFMDGHDMWKDTLLIVNTDHGYLLGDHGYFAKNYMPTYEPIAHTPFFVWDPRCGAAGGRRNALAQTIDIAPTLLDYFGVERPAEMLGMPLRGCIEADAPVRDFALFGYFGKHLNITDGRHVYMRCGRQPADGLLNEYTLMPQHLFRPFTVEELRRAEKTLTDEFSFTRGVPVLKIPTSDAAAPANSAYMYDRHLPYGDLLFDLAVDPGQTAPLRDAAQETRLAGALRELMAQNEAPAELYQRLDL